MAVRDHRVLAQRKAAAAAKGGNRNMPKVLQPDKEDVSKAMKAADKSALPNTTTVKISRFLREYITAKAQWNESIDHTVRRLLGLPQDGQEA
jgi:hypothetical protein